MEGGGKGGKGSRLFSKAQGQYIAEVEDQEEGGDLQEDEEGEA